MANRTLGTSVHCVLDWSLVNDQSNLTRTAIGIERAWHDFSSRSFENKPPIVLFGSAPKAMEALLEMVSKGFLARSLIIGMPVGFVSVLESKNLLANN